MSILETFADDVFVGKRSMICNVSDAISASSSVSPSRSLAGKLNSATKSEEIAMKISSKGMVYYYSMRLLCFDRTPNGLIAFRQSVFVSQHIGTKTRTRE